MPVLIDATSLNRRMKGVGRYAWQLCEGLHRHLPDDVELHLLAFDRELPDFSSNFRGIVHRIPYCSELSIGMSAVPKLINRVGTKCLIRPADKIGKRYGIPTLTVCHDINPLIWEAQPPRTWRRRFVDAAWERLRGNALRSSELVICNSRFIQRAAIEYFHLDESKTAIGYCGVDQRIPQYAAGADLNAIRREYGPSGFVLTFATGDEREGFRILPSLWKSAREAGYPGHLVVAGVKSEEVYSHELRSAFSSAGVADSVRFLPFLGENQLHTLAGLYGAADFYLETSRHEGFGMQLVEAMACGTTCFSSGRGALNEVGGGFPLHLAIGDPEAAGCSLATAWQSDLHRRDNISQVEYAKSFDWSQPIDAVVKFTLQHVGI